MQRGSARNGIYYESGRFMSDGKIMFEIYRDAREGIYPVVYYTELDDHTKDLEIGRAAAGEPLFDGFLQWVLRSDGKKAIGGSSTNSTAAQRLARREFANDWPRS